MLEKRKSYDAEITQNAESWRLSLENGDPSTYRLAQLDDYTRLARRHFLWREQASLRLAARVSASDLPGTWGFGFWNDPFTVSLGLQGAARRLPALPNACWFFYASAQNHLSFTGQTKKAAAPPPANGFLAQTFSAARIPSAWLAPGALALPFLLIRPISKWLRENLAAKLIREDAQRLSVDVTKWHAYRLRWRKNRVDFFVNEVLVFSTATSPKGPLGFVLWIDNQFAAWHMDGSLAMGALANPPMWLEIKGLEVLDTE